MVNENALKPAIKSLLGALSFFLTILKKVKDNTVLR